MDNRYFPHLSGGSNYKLRDSGFAATFNFSVNGPTAIDPRNIISEWTHDSLLTMTNNDVYAGLQIYCLQDKAYRICRWVPTIANATFTANNCLWDTLHTEDDSSEWFDVQNDDWYQPSINEQISIEESKQWRYTIKNNAAIVYLGFHKFNDDDFSECNAESTAQNVFNDVIAAPNDTYKNIYAFSKLAVKATDVISIKLSTLPLQVEKLRDHHLVVIIPLDVYAKYNVIVTDMNNEITAPFTTKEITLDVIGDDNDLHPVDFVMYIMNSPVRYTADEQQLIDMTCTVKKIAKI